MRRRNPHAALRGFFAAQILFIPRKRGHEGARPSSIMTSQPGVTCTTTSSNAIPLTGTGTAGLTIGLLLTLVKKERGTMRLIGIVLNALSLGFTLAYGFRDCDKPSSFNNSSG